MRVLITGGAGFIGHEVVRSILARTNWDVVSLDRLDTSGTLDRLAEILDEHKEWRKRLIIVWHDLKAPINNHVARIIGEVNLILHLAASSHVDRSLVDPVSFVMDNVIGTANLLEFSRHRLMHCIRMFFNFGTDEIFGPATSGMFFQEDDRYNCTNPYSATKAGAEVLAKSFHHSYGLPVVTTHTMNVFGKRQHPEKFIPRIIRNVMSHETTLIHADPTCTVPGSRFYISASDVAEAILFLIEHAKEGESYNIVGSEELNNLELAKIVADAFGKDLVYKFVDFHSSRPGHDLRYALSGEKMAKMGWQVHGSVKEQIKEVVRWTIANDRWLY